MGNLLTSLLNSTNALNVFSQGLQVVQNDVTNSSTPGYVTQTATFDALPFDISSGRPGGVTAGPVQSSRDLYAEQNVRTAQSNLGFSTQQASDLAQVSSLFSVNGTSGIAPALDGLFSSFSALSVNPNDTTTRQAVLNNATTVAQAVNQVAQGLGSASQQVAGNAQSQIAEINTLAGTIATINASGVRDPQGNVDAGLDAQLNSTLEQLSQYTNVSALQQPNGTTSVFIAGQTPLVVGSQVDAIQGDFSAPQATILDSTGRDITSQITGGQLAGSLDDYNTKLPSYVTSLNTLAQGVADQVNTALGNGVDQNGNAPTQNLFTYNALAPALTLAVNSALTPDQLAAALPSAPGGNGNALNLASLGSAQTLNGATFAAYYGQLGSQVGSDSATATANQTTQTSVLTQAQTLRSDVSGVSLDTEASRLIQFQSGYQAITKMITILDDLTSSVINMIDTGS
jgi:flagellar hook-associated protein 1 FlgK